MGQTLQSHVTIASADGSRTEVIYTTTRHFEAPNWSRDGRWLLLNSEGKLWRLPVEGGEPALVPTGAVTGINNDHGLSPDGRTIAISAGHIYTVAADGGEPKQITSRTPSYWHGWSPDGRTLAYCAERGGVFNLYGISVEGGEETRLTTGPGADDGPDYSPDGRWIYFNSNRSGAWRIWRIPASGGGPDDRLAEQITDDAEFDDWFPHPSPDGKWLLMLSYPGGTQGHPPNLHVTLRRMPLPGAGTTGERPRTFTRLFGGQGTINVPSWSPDSERFAYVSYTLG